MVHHWQRLSYKQRVALTDEMAEAAGLDNSYARKLLRLTPLAPRVLGAIDCATRLHFGGAHWRNSASNLVELSVATADLAIIFPSRALRESQWQHSW